MTDPLFGIDGLMSECLWHIDAKCEEIGWNQDARLFALMVERDLTKVDGGSVGLVAMLPIPGWELAMIATSTPPEALAIITGVLAEAPPGLTHHLFPPDKLYGVALITEAWMLRAPLNGSISDADMAFVREHGAVNHPERIESRFIYCLSKDGEVCALTHEKDGIAQPLDRDDASIGGQLVDLLAGFLKVLT